MPGPVLRVGRPSSYFVLLSLSLEELESSAGPRHGRSRRRTTSLMKFDIQSGTENACFSGVFAVRLPDLKVKIH
jgi:hypothetical protein